MTIKFEELFSVHFEHKCFADSHFTGFRLSLTEESESMFKKIGLFSKPLKDGFQILFETPFEGSASERISLLNENITLQFRIDIEDPYFYNYTGNIPDSINNRIFRFSNFDEKQKVKRDSDLLHMAEYVSESDIKLWSDSDYLLTEKIGKPFGYIEIRLNADLKKIMYIRFLNKSRHWRYILISDNFRNYEKLAILNKVDQTLFKGPEIIQIPDGKKCIAFTSNEPIPMTQHYNNSFQLGDNYDQSAKHFRTVLISKLPYPNNIEMISKISNGNEHNISEIFL